ncbi:hypothetical protein [Emticicia agri]|uniref:Uncharacterized protein n=1 Tax=Emticicia agri TaxID=2492393 RepID=A0A4Q5M4A3_9BACT|nr:hypothetical protein [Emticicia agri]RYU97188.1 hypothetical protein EWM59_02530 [Emticicia agri]
MKICFLLHLIFFFSVGSVSAQKEMMQSTRDALTRDVKIGQHNSTMLYGFDNRTTEIQGSFYLDPDWSVATVRFYPRTISTPKGLIKLDSVTDVQMRVLLKGNDVEFNTQEGIKVISGNLIRSFTIKKQDFVDRNYISTQEFTDNSEKVKSGFFEILADGKVKLLEYSKLKIHQPDYVEAFNIGSKDVKINTEKLWFITKGKEVIKFSAGKRDLYEVMADKKPEIEKFVKDNHLSLKDKTDLIKVFQYFNTI